MRWLRARTRGTPPSEAEAPDPADDDLLAGGVPTDEAVEIPIDGVLDLHWFHPRDTRTLVPDYLDACHQRGITQVRIIHGKGTGALRKSVHAQLKRHPLVIGFRLAGEDAGGWGATQVDLQPLDED